MDKTPTEIIFELCGDGSIVRAIVEEIGNGDFNFSSFYRIDTQQISVVLPKKPVYYFCSGRSVLEYLLFPHWNQALIHLFFGYGELEKSEQIYQDRNTLSVYQLNTDDGDFDDEEDLLRNRVERFFV